MLGSRLVFLRASYHMAEACRRVTVCYTEGSSKWLARRKPTRPISQAFPGIRECLCYCGVRLLQAPSRTHGLQYSHWITHGCVSNILEAPSSV